MKAIVFFMAIYILVLSAVPCNDMHNKCNSKNVKSVLTQNHNHQQDKDDSCSASVVALNFTPFRIKKPAVFSITQKIIIRNFSFVSNYFGTIWQPPKITVTA